MEPVKVTQPAKLARQPLKQHSQGQPGQREPVKKVKVKNCAHNLQLYCFHMKSCNDKHVLVLVYLHVCDVLTYQYFEFSVSALTFHVQTVM